MTAHSRAVACGIAVLTMGAIDPAAAFDDRRTFTSDRTVNADGRATDPVTAGALADFHAGRPYDAIAADRQSAWTAGGRGLHGKQPQPNFKSYAGFGIEKFKLSMDFESGDVALKKDKGFSKPRVILGMGYKVTDSISLGFEYRALASEKPLFSFDVGGETLNVDTRFTTHNVFLKAKYRF